MIMTAHGRSLSHVGRPPGPSPEIPSSHSPDSRFGRETGRESPFPDSAGIKGTFVHFEARRALLVKRASDIPATGVLSARLSDGRWD
jgi:hypothetical protein